MAGHYFVLAKTSSLYIEYAFRKFQENQGKFLFNETNY